MNKEIQKINSHNFSVAFEQMCVISAVSQTRNSEETFQELILYCLARFPDENFSSLDNIQEALLVMSGLDIPISQIELGITSLKKQKKLLTTDTDEIQLPEELKNQLLQNVQQAEALEDQVRIEWFADISSNNDNLSLESLWKALRKYLTLAFRRHGIQTVSLLNPLTTIDEVDIGNLTSMLNSAVDEIPKEQKEYAMELIRNFMASVGKSDIRTRYITQLADSAFNYFALAIIPEIANDFRKNLSPLALFLDTNFIFGILDLSVNSQVAISIELLEAIEKHKLPFHLLFHQATENELLSSISSYKNIMRQTEWAQNISRGILNSRSVNGVELRYHQKNSEEKIDVDSYFAPYEHSDILLSEKNIEKFIPDENRKKIISALSSEYSKYLENINRDKPNKLIEHDMTVLDTVRKFRTKSTNSLEAGALLLTCDYTLFGYDWEASKRDGTLPSTVLPNLFWQLIRPFVPSDIDFDRSFAETFAIPEFRLIGSKASITASKIAALLNSYKGISEELATKILSNDLLINTLRNYLADELVFNEKVEHAIIGEHEELEEEYSILKNEIEQKDQSIAELSCNLATKEEEISKRLEIEDSLRSELQSTQIEDQEKQKKWDEEKHTLESNLEKTKTTLRILISVVLSIIVIMVFEIVSYKLPWEWFVNHPKNLGLQGCVIFLFPSLIFWLLIPKYRKSPVLLGVIIPVLLLLLSIIDG